MIVGVLAIHNEEQYLPFILHDLDLCTDEVLAVIDRCTDRSGTLISRYHWLKVVKDTKLVWMNTCAQAKALGLQFLPDGYEYLLMTDADVIVNCEAVADARRILDSVLTVDLVSFVYRQYSLFGSWKDRVHDEIANLLSWFTRKFRLQPVRSGIYLVRKEKAVLHDEPSEYDCLHQKLNCTYVVGGVHLRPRYDKLSQLNRGRARCYYSQYSFWKVLVSSLVKFEPFMLKGFIQGKVAN
jgi:hypothetical protein